MIEANEQSALAEDAISRERALEFASFIVEAPAGAGKTELLTQRYLKLLQVVDEPEEIIAITFTNKAAAEMRLRILDGLLNAAAGKVPEAAHKQKTYDLSVEALKRSQTLNWCLIENPARLRIFTIDGLCAYLARQMPLMSRFGSQPAIADDPASHYAQAAEQTLAMIDDVTQGSIVRESLRYLDNDAVKLKKLLVNMLAKRDQWLHYSQNHVQEALTEAKLQETLENMVSAEIAAIAQVVSDPIQHALMPFARYAAKNIPESSIAGLCDWESYLLQHAESLTLWQSLADLLLTGVGTLRKTVTVRDGFPSEGKAQKQDFIALLNSLAGDQYVEDALNRIRTLPTLKNNQVSWKMITTLSQLLNLAAAQLWLVFQQTKEVDFVAVSQRAIAALEDASGEATELALRLDYQIKHILVDEFQDTSPSQIQLLEKLTLGWQEADSRTLFCVGDPMQSIYRFRKANVGLFLHAAAHGIGHIRLQNLKLKRNNRSCPAVVDWINQSFRAIFSTHDDTTKGAITYRAFISTKSAENDTGITIHPIVKSVDESLEDAKKREALAVINIILQSQAIEKNRKIAVLVRAKSHLQALVSELRRSFKHIRFQAVEIEALENRQIVQDLLALTRALHHKADRVNWLAVLRAPWCGLSLHDMHALAGKHHHRTIWSLMLNDEVVATLTEDGQRRLTHVQKIFAEAFAHQGRENVSRWLRGVWLMLGGASCLWEESDVIDVQAFFACIEQLDRTGQFTLDRMTQEIEKLFAAPDAQGEMLQMMTIHKSKGLEFDTVILPGLGNTTGGNDDKPIVLWEELAIETESGVELQLLAAPMVPKGHAHKDSITPYDYLNTLEKERASYEDARVLYVAATRTERKLHLLGIANKNKEGEIKPNKNSYLDMLWPVVSPVYLKDEASHINATHAHDMTQFIPRLVRLQTLHIPIQLDATTAFQSSATEQRISTRNLEMQNKAPINNDVNQIQINIGILAHFYLEIISKQGLEIWSESKILNLKSAMQFWFNQRGFNQDEALIAAHQVQKLLLTTLQSVDGRWVLQTRTAAESELEIEYIDHQTVQKKMVDRTFIEDGVRWIIDYKSIDLTGILDTQVLISYANQHRAQLEAYASLFKTETLVIQKAVFFLSIGRLIELRD